MGLLGTWGCRNFREYIRHPWDSIGGGGGLHFSQRQVQLTFCKFL